MDIECLGASREVGRSAFLLSTDKKILLDYGIKIFDESGEAKFPLETPLSAKPDFAILSHAHLDHSGCIPALYNKNKIRWYATPPTKDICEVLWQDSMKIMGEGLPYGLPEFNKALKYWSPLLYGQTMHTGDTKIRLLDAGHIAGSAMIEVEHKEKFLLYTGDFKCEDTLMQKGAKPEKTDTLVMESTYAKREHPDRNKIEKQLMDDIEETIGNNANVLLPSFALGRTQELIALIRKYNKDVPVFVDGMGREITDIYLRYPNYIKDVKTFRKAVQSVKMVEGIPDKRAETRRKSASLSKPREP